MVFFLTIAIDMFASGDNEFYRILTYLLIRTQGHQ